MRFSFALICLLLSTFALANQTQDELLVSSPEQIASFSIEQDFLIGGLVSPLSGQPVLRHTDLIVKGAQELLVNRVYVPFYLPYSFPEHKHHKEDWRKLYLYQYLSKNYRGWKIYPHQWLQFNPFSMTAIVSDSHGTVLKFLISNSTRLASPSYALTNVSGDIPSGKFDPRNTCVSFDRHSQKVHVNAPDGTFRLYGHYRSHFYLLEKEILPNGKVIRYDYDAHARLKEIRSLDPKERHVYASIRCESSPENQQWHLTTSTSQTADYHYQIKQEKTKTRQPVGRKGKKLHVHDTHLSPPILLSASSPFFRHETINYSDQFLLESHSSKSAICTFQYAGFGEGAQHYKIHKLLLPVGSNDTLYPVHEMSYHPPIAGQKEGSTTVKNRDGTSIVYHFSKQILPTTIHYFGADGSLKKEKIFSWTEKQWLKSIEVKDGQSKIFFKRSYEYDRFGNPILEEFHGDLTGSAQFETCMTRRVFSEDGRNLLLKEETEEGKVTCFSYLPNTNLVISKLTKDRDTIVLREFFHYDDCNNLIQTIIDDGTSSEPHDLTHVTQRKTTTISLRQQQPFLHMPEWVEEKCFEDGFEKLLKRTHLNYDQYGNVNREEIYDADGIYAYTISREYNERGTLISETNALGQKAKHEDDARGRLTSSVNFSNRLITTLRYDTKGRLCERVEKGDDGLAHSTSYDYDFHDLLVQKTDPFQNKVQYAYDPLIDKVARTEFPCISSPTGETHSVITSSSYDALGNEITQIDANGNTTTYQYNAYGSPILITYPDGTQESFRYTKSGKLSSHTDPDGLTIVYKHDIVGRVLSKNYLFSEEQIAEEVFTYNSFHLLTETDKEGHLTQYSYDGAGRKIREGHCRRVTEFGYDSLGRLSSVCKHHSGNRLFIYYKRDLFDRILEESKTTAQGDTLYTIAYTYDEDGNQKTITRFINGQEATETFRCDSLGRLIEFQDALGHIQQTVFDENHTNSLGQKILKIIKTDPCKTTTIKTHDALGRLKKKERFNPQGQSIACQEMFYDPAGNLTDQLDHVYKDIQFLKTNTLQYTYTAKNQLESLTRAPCTSDARTTTYSYFPSGKIATKRLPNGILLNYAYHPLKFLSRLDSSDGAIHHAFEYNLLGQLISASDENQNIAIKREVDPFGNITREELPNDIAIEKEFDDFDRLTSLKISDIGEITYTYNPLHLKEVTRFSRKGQVIYSHQYEKYDLDGNLVIENLMGSLGQIIHTTDLKGRKIGISSPYFSEICTYDPSGNLLRSVLDKTEHTYTYDDLSQLTSEDQTVYAYDSLYNRIQKNEDICEINDLNELLVSGHGHCDYDLNGNLSTKQTAITKCHFIHDPLNRLIEANADGTTISFLYDPLGRRLSKTVLKRGFEEVEHYLYDGFHEIGAITENHALKNLKVHGIGKQSPSVIAIEIEDQIFAPLIDIHSNICRLINPSTRTIADSDEFTAFGEASKPSSHDRLFNPWRFASKRWDPELRVVYFGKRYYDPELGRWLEPDPAGFTDSVNLYQYVFNNPFSYSDPDGQFAWMIPLLIWGAEIAVPSLSAIAIPALYGAVAGAVAYGGYKAIEALNKNYRSSSAWDLSNHTLNVTKSANVDDQKETKKKKPPYSGEELGNDPTKCPGEGFKWKGKGAPESGQGSWVKENDTEKEILHPDLNHPPPKKPHWDYTGPDWEDGVRLNIDGTWEPKG